ncbi:MAG: hypothetical protein KF845_06650 [Cyclobacteriaceae bacterium]|nr:hypothetical protein [Cyclobacteriaceae bacterium]
MLLKKTDKSKSKQVREAYRDEVKKQASRYENVDIDALKERVRKKIQRNVVQERITRVISLTFLTAIVLTGVWAIVSFDFTVKNESPFANKEALFITKIYPHDQPGYKLKVDYYHHGAKAAETMTKDGLNHQTSESYYSTGEQFRSALYYYDTLIREVYFYKDGDTIKNFPVTDYQKVYQVKLQRPDKKTTIEFYFYDGKIIQYTYHESPSASNISEK